MNEPQTLLAIENLMKAVIQKTYHWRNLKSDHVELRDEARTAHHSYREYTPLIQAYFDLLPEKIRLRDEEIFNNRAVFQEFQSEIKEAQKKFIQGFKRNNRRNQRNLEEYFAALVEDSVSLDSKALLKLHPEMLQQFSQNKAGTRRFQIYTD